MAELFKEIRSAYRLDEDRDIRLPMIQAILTDLVNTYTPSITQPIAALAWFLGERRDVTSAETLISVIAASSYVGGIMHFTAVDAAFDALWKGNAKLQLPGLVRLMQRANETGRRNIGALLSRLLSTDVMLSPDLLGEEYEQPGYWEARVAAANARTQADWDRYDVNSLYWEYRYLAARRLPAEDVANRAKLARDEVRPVADAARGDE
ncbi:MAG: hypothetical protein LGR52_04985 [Candidatus Thiosymbion ectosymbiont of Robbea hypermnestra]|nr:hypothetical protein [Candidatus Thiosymbion ectosymbiont of Robbea hypermnestra]